METSKQDHLQLSLLGFTTLTLKLISSGNDNLLKRSLIFITRLFMQSSPEVREIIIEHYLCPIYNFLNDCEHKADIINMFPFWMRTEYLKMMKKNEKQERAFVFMLHLN
jgi:hypothetical protein